MKYVFVGGKECMYRLSRLIRVVPIRISVNIRNVNHAGDIRSVKASLSLTHLSFVASKTVKK